MMLLLGLTSQERTFSLLMEKEGSKIKITTTLLTSNHSLLRELKCNEDAGSYKKQTEPF